MKTSWKRNFTKSMFTENAMPKIWFTDLPRAIFLRLGSLEIDRGFRLWAQRKLLRQNIWKCQVGPDLPIEVWGGLLRYLEVGCSLYWPEAFGFFKTCQAITSKDANIRPSGNFRGFVKGKYPGDNDRGCSASHRSLSAPVYVLDCVCHLLLTRISRR